jgi:hypothetical protein
MPEKEYAQENFETMSGHEEYHRHASGAHRALAFPDFLGFLVGLGLEAYKRQYRQEEVPDVSPEGEYGEPPRTFRKLAFREGLL